MKPVIGSPYFPPGLQLPFLGSDCTAVLQVPRARTEPWPTGGASLSRDHLCGTVFRLLYWDRRWHCTLSSNNSRPICSTSDVSTNRRNIHHARRCCGVFRDSGAGYKTADLLTYLLTYLCQYQLILLGDTGTNVQTICLASLNESVTAKHWTHNQYTTTPHCLVLNPLTPEFPSKSVPQPYAPTSNCQNKL